MSQRAYVFDDVIADGFAPFALTRPCGEILYGRWSVRERVERTLRRAVEGHITRAWLASYVEPGAPAVVPVPETADAPTLLWSSRAVPDGDLPDGPANVWIAGDLAGISLGAGDDMPDSAWPADPSPVPGLLDVEIEGEWLSATWDIVARGPDRLLRDLESGVERPGDDGAPDGVHRLGEAPLVLGEGASIEPGVLIDTRQGPIELGAGVEVRAGARLEGPLYAGDRSRLLGGAICALSAGPYSYLRGEIEEVTAFGYCNKAHDGFLGHAVIGRWVNLGAMTTNSDLKNNYGVVRVGPPEDMVDTGLTKLGSLIGDHVKTGIGVLLNTGTVIGAGSNIFGAELPPKWVLPFSWGRGNDLTEYRREAFLETAAAVMPRRGVAADESTLAWLGAAWDEARR